jgi:hypothetical protein
MIILCIVERAHLSFIKRVGKKRKRTTWLTTESRGPLGELTDWTLPNQQVHNIHKQWGTTWLAALLQKLGAHFGELTKLNSAKSLIMEKNEIFDSFWKICIF